MFFPYPPLPFRWRPVLPIAYENYVSETEILQAMVNKLNEITERFNDFVEKLPEEIRTTAIATFNEYIKPVKQSIDELDGLVSDLGRRMSAVEKLADKNMSAIDKLSEKLIRDIDTVLQHIENVQRELSDNLDAAETAIRNDMETMRNSLMAQINDTDTATRVWVSDKLSDMTEEYDNKLDGYFDLMLWYLKYSVAEMKKYADELSHNLIVTNPVSGRQDTIDNALMSLFMLHSGAPTCEEYRMYNLTAEEYRALRLTCWQYRFYGLWGAKQPWERPKFYNCAGLETYQPNDAYNYWQLATASPSAYDWTADEWKRILSVGAGRSETFGMYVYGNVYPAMPHNMLHCKVETITITLDDEHRIDGMTDRTVWKYTSDVLPVMLTDTTLQPKIAWDEQRLEQAIVYNQHIDWVIGGLMNMLSIQFEQLTIVNNVLTVIIRVETPQSLPTGSVVCNWDAQILAPLKNYNRR